MIKPIIKSFGKITILTLVFFVLFYLGSSVINAWWWSSDTKTENKDNFTSIENNGLSEVGVALNINVGTKFYKGKSNLNSSFYNDIVSIETINTDRNLTNEVLITKNIDALRDYLNVVKIDVKGYLDSSSDRKDNYESLMNQLKIRYKTGYANAKNLSSQIETISIHITELNNSIENIKQAMSINLKGYNAKGLSKNINDYIEIKNEYTLMKVYLIFCNRFLAYYNFLNSYNKNTITTLKLNEDAIIKNIYVVIPNSGSDLVNKLNLIYTEGDLPANSTESDTVVIDNNSSSTNNSNNNNSNTSFDIDTSSNNLNGNGIFGDPFNLKNSNSEVIKETGKMDFGSSNVTNK